MSETSLHQSFITDAVRTPIGRLGGALAGVRPDDLLAGVLSALRERPLGTGAPGADSDGADSDAAAGAVLDPGAVDEVYAGDANGAGEDNRNVARMALLLAGYPTTVPAATVNRLCGSGLEAFIAASRSIAVGDNDVVIAGGVESMSRAPWVVEKPAKGYPTAHQQMWNSALGWRMINPKMPGEWTVALGEGAELLADKYSISREEQDEFALASHQKAAAAWAAGHFAGEVAPVAGVDLERDECVRPDSSLESLAKLRAVFRQGGTVTAGNASPMNDGAAAVVVMSEAGLQRTGATPLARVVSRATSGVEPQLYGIGPVEAANRALERAGIGWGDLSAVELNEAFAAQSLACLREWPDLDPAIVNPLGGAIAIGHPLGGSGVRILTTLVHHLRRTGGRYGLATMCIGVGQGIAVVVENVA